MCIPLHTYHEETVSSPQRRPTLRTEGDRGSLAVNSNNGTRRLTNHAATDVGLYGRCRDGHHGHSLTSGQPVAVVVPGGVLALAKDVTV